MAEPFYITTPIYYVNARPHLGTAYTTLVADARARFERMDGKDVFFLTGTDEHGQKIANTAEQNNMSPAEWTDTIAKEFKELWDKLNISNDYFIRTTEQAHLRAVKHMAQLLYDKGYIYKSAYDGWYCVHDETFFTDTQVRHANEEAGTPTEHNCPDCGRPLSRLEEESWFFKLSEFTEPLLKYIEEHPDFIQPEIRRNEVVSFVKTGLKDLSISRSSFDWGIELPFDKEHVAYVWIDALTNYLSAIGFGDPQADAQANFKRRWPADVHLVGKDIIRFHCVIWPALLMAAGLPLPKQVFAHGFLLMKGEKMSKSKGNVIAPEALVKAFGLDAYRYYFLTEVQPGADGSISIERMTQVFNADLANTWGNLCSRSLNMSAKYFDGKSPTLHGLEDSAIENPLKELSEIIYPQYCTAMREMNFKAAVQPVFQLLSAANLYIEQMAPWELAKNEKNAELAQVIYNVLESIRIAAYYLAPFMPDTSKEVLSRMSIDIETQELSLEQLCKWGGLSSGLEVRKGEALFPRLNLEELEIPGA